MLCRCFILGAGFSKCCGLPLARELTPNVSKLIATPIELEAGEPHRFMQPGDFGYPHLQNHLKAIRTLFPDHACDLEMETSWPDFEQLITSLDEAARYQSAYEKITGRQTTNWADDTKWRVMSGLEELLSQTTKAITPAGLKQIQEFVVGLDVAHDAVISFNWDVIIEIACDDLGILVRYRDDQQGLKLIKPHGSLNLVDAPKTKFEAIRQTATNVYGLDEEFEYDSEEKHVILRAKDPRQARLRQTWAEARLLVEPNLRKVYDNSWIEAQWVRALDMVRGADEIVVIGFSLPRADLRPRILLQLTRLQRPSPPSLLIVDPNASFLRDHFRRFTGLDAKPFDGTLEQWLHSGSPSPGSP